MKGGKITLVIRKEEDPSFYPSSSFVFHDVAGARIDTFHHPEGFQSDDPPVPIDENHLAILFQSATMTGDFKSFAMDATVVQLSQFVEDPGVFFGDGELAGAGDFP